MTTKLSQAGRFLWHHALSLLLAIVGLSILLTGITSIRTAVIDGRAFYTTRVLGQGFPKQLYDPSGFQQTVPAPPQRIVSTILSGDEMLTALVTPERLAAVTYLVDDTSTSNCAGILPTSIPRLQPQAETVIALQPDLVLMAGYSPAEIVRLFLAAGIPVLRFNWYGSFQEVMANIRTLGAVLGADAQATEIITTMQQRINAITQRVAGKTRARVLYYTIDGYTAGAGTLIDEMIHLAGGTNAVHDIALQGHTRLALEAAIQLAPEVIVFADWNPTDSDAPAAPPFTDPAVWQHVPAVQYGRVYAVKGARLTAVSQYAVDALEAIARLLHPESFRS